MKESGEMYLETIYQLGEGQAVKSVDVANKMGVSRPSVNKAINALMALGYAEKGYYTEIQLTEAGRQKAQEVIFKHKIITRFLIATLGLDAVCAENDACRIEHIISDAAIQKMVEYLKEKSPEA